MGSWLGCDRGLRRQRATSIGLTVGTKAKRRSEVPCRLSLRIDAHYHLRAFRDDRVWIWFQALLPGLFFQPVWLLRMFGILR